MSEKNSSRNQSSKSSVKINFDFSGESPAENVPRVNFEDDISSISTPQVRMTLSESILFRDDGEIFNPGEWEDVVKGGLYVAEYIPTHNPIARDNAYIKYLDELTDLQVCNPQAVSSAAKKVPLSIFYLILRNCS